MWKLFCIAGTPEFHTPPTAHRLPVALPLQGTQKVVSGPGKAFAWYLLGLICAGWENPAPFHPLGRSHVRDTLREKGLSHFGAGCELQQD